MAFYHVNQCDCAMGCCTCGPSDPNESKKQLMWAWLEDQDMYPKDIWWSDLWDDGYMLLGRDTEEKKPKNGAYGVYYIGQLHPPLTVNGAITWMNDLQLKCESIKLSRIITASMVHSYGRRLEQAIPKKKKEEFKTVANRIFSRQFERLVTDWNFL